MDTKTNVARGLYLIARPLDVGESFTIDRGANSLTFDTMTLSRTLTGRVRGLSADPMFFASRVLPDGTMIQHGHVAALARWLDPDTRIFVTRDPKGLGLVLCRVGSGAKVESTLTFGPANLTPGLGADGVLDGLRRELARLANGST